MLVPNFKAFTLKINVEYQINKYYFKNYKTINVYDFAIDIYFLHKILIT